MSERITPQKKGSWPDEPSKRQIGGWRAVSAKGLQGEGSRKRNDTIFHTHKHTGMRTSVPFADADSISLDALMERLAPFGAHDLLWAQIGFCQSAISRRGRESRQRRLRMARLSMGMKSTVIVLGVLGGFYDFLV